MTEQRVCHGTMQAAAKYKPLGGKLPYLKMPSDEEYFYRFVLEDCSNILPDFALRLL